MIERLDYIEKRLKDEKIRNLIKTKILNNLIYLRKFISLSPGVVSPGKVDNKISEIRGYINIWIKNKSLIDDINSFFIDFRKRYLELEDMSETDVEEVINSEVTDCLKTSQPTAVPNYVKKLLKEVDPIKGDVSYLPIGPCSHYCIVYKVIDNISYVIPLTTTLGVFSGYEISKSRFFKGIAIYTLYQFPTSLVKEKLTIPYDHKGELRDIFKSVEKEFRSIFPRVRIKTPKTL